MTETTNATPAKAPRTKKAPPLPVPCWCGCGGTTQRRFVPGHDSRFHSAAKRVARGEADEATETARLAHDEARAAFRAAVEHERPHAALLAAARAAVQAAKEARKNPGAVYALAPAPEPAAV